MCDFPGIMPEQQAVLQISDQGIKREPPTRQDQLLEDLKVRKGNSRCDNRSDQPAPLPLIRAIRPPCDAGKALSAQNKRSGEYGKPQIGQIQQQKWPGLKRRQHKKGRAACKEQHRNNSGRAHGHGPRTLSVCNVQGCITP